MASEQAGALACTLYTTSAYSSTFHHSFVYILIIMQALRYVTQTITSSINETLDSRQLAKVPESFMKLQEWFEKFILT